MADCECGNEGTQLLMETLQLRVPQIGKAALQVELGNALREFCVRTAAWRHEIRMSTAPSQTVYVIGPVDNDTTICEIVSVQCNGFPVQGWAGDYAPLSMDDPRAFLWGFTAAPEGVDDPDGLNVLLVPAATIRTKPQQLVVSVALKPRARKLVLPPLVLDNYFDVVMHCALSRIYAHLDRPYTQLNEAERYRRLWLAGMSRARVKTKARYTMGEPAWRYPPFASGRPNRRRGNWGWGV